MPRLRFNYKTRIDFSERVQAHHFLLRILPFDNQAQQLINGSYYIEPQGKISVSKDTFGNKIICGYIDQYHDFFEFSSEGTVFCREYKLIETLNPLYLYPSIFTKPVQRVQDLYLEFRFPHNSSVHEKVGLISEKINSLISYTPGATGIHTTADEALALKQGVCQDFAHIMIALCRLSNIPARYVAGFIEGEGFTHAWVEYYADRAWFGFDPTHDRKVETTGYIKISHGRDYSDCVVDKGVFRGLVQQKLEVLVKLEQEDQQ
jgi:Transglutaminase-like superfamily/Bacterial transglutaminase-like N-terminal region